MKTKKQQVISPWSPRRSLAAASRSILVCLFLFTFGAFTILAADSCPRTKLKLSEICYWPTNGQPQWVELFNTGTESVDARGMELVSGTNAYSLPIDLAELPTNGFIVVYFDGGGTNDTSFAGDNLAVLHSSTTNFLGNPAGFVALYQVTGVHTPSTLADFLAWGGPPGTNATLAVQKNIQSDTNSFIPTQTNPAFAPKGPFFPMPVGGALDFVNGAWVTYDQSSTTPGAPNALIARPYMTDPSGGEWFDGDPSWFRWVLQPGADHFELQVATDNSFVNLAWDLTNLVSTTYIPGTNSLPVGTNWCRVRSFSADGAASPWSIAVSFQVGIPIISPPAGARGSIAPKKTSAAPINTIQGRVIDTRTHNGLIGVIVVLNAGATVVDSTTSDAFGRFALSASNGDYTIVCSLANYSTIPATPINVTASVAGLTINATGDSGTLSTPISPLGAKKDTPLLQVRNFGGKMCEKTATALDQAWDQPHTKYHPNGGELESWYCWAVTTTMIARHVGGTLFVDEVVNKVKNLSFESAASATDADMSEALKFALQTTDASLNYTRVKFTDAQVRNAITNNLPIAYSTPRHWMTIDGFQYEDERLKCHFVNVDNMATARNLDFLLEPWDSGYIPSSGLSGRAADGEIWDGSAWVDTDADGVLDFDEDNRFNSDKTKTDTDGDGIPDKIEIASWAFPRDGIGGNIAGKEFAPASGMKAQYTADTDGGGVKDGDEDKNQNGISGKWDTANPGETDVFDPKDDASLDLVFCIDTTGSMGPYIAGVQANMVSIINYVAGNFPQYRIAIVGYKDYPDQDSAYLNYIYSSFDTNTDNLITTVNSMDVGGGGDTPEAVYSGIIECITDPALGGWRPSPVKRVIITMGDAPAHDPEENGFTLADVQAAADSGGPTYDLALYLPGSVKSRAAAKAVATVHTNTLSGPISVFPVWVGDDATAGASWTNIASVTGGSVVQAPTGSDVSAGILSQIDAIKASTTASLNVTGPSGETDVRGLTNIVADASHSFDPNGCGILKYEWDWNGDGTYDETTLGPVASHDYPGGFFGPLKMRVTTVGGDTATATFALVPLSTVTVAVASQTTNTNIDRQTGLFYQSVVVTNQGGADVSGLRLTVGNLAANVMLIGATGTNGAGQPYLEFTNTVPVGGTLALTLAFYSADRVAPTPVTTVDAASVATPPPVSGTPLSIARAYLRANDGKMVVEFTTIPGRRYVIEYSSDMTTWKQISAPVTALGTWFVWVDAGPPFTDSPPAAGARFYRIQLLP